MSSTDPHPQLNGYRFLCLFNAVVYIITKSVLVYMEQSDCCVGTCDLVCGFLLATCLWWLGLYEQHQAVLPPRWAHFLFQGHFWTHPPFSTILYHMDQLLQGLRCCTTRLCAIGRAFIKEDVLESAYPSAPMIFQRQRPAPRHVGTRFEVVALPQTAILHPNRPANCECRQSHCYIQGQEESMLDSIVIPAWIKSTSW
ncbi:hypothetical protein DL96DRAFT_241432 [Flagelloscypha sp. PMI_526]|nr:hypothetical protein DL96DRAFT_241432 [Flagelloscypha sp. PMI_526]